MSTQRIKAGHLSVPPGIVIPPLRFSVVEEKLYRGSYPRPLNFEFLESLHLKTILSLTADPLNEAASEWCHIQEIQMVHICPEGSDRKGVPLGHNDAVKILQVRPILSKHRNKTS
jgi:tyrosine-protein phosphatase OCA6